MRLSWLFLALALIGCDNDFDPASLVNGLRVLAIRAEPPELGPGEQTFVDALVPPLGGDAGAPSYEWVMCMEPPVPASGMAVNPDCVDNETAPYLIPIGTTPEVVVTMPNVGPQDLGLPDATGGFYVPIRLTVRAGAAKVVSVYRLRLSVIGPPNHNPQLTGVFLVGGGGDGGAPDGGTPNLIEVVDGMPPSVNAQVPVVLLATIPATGDGAAETYQMLSGDSASDVMIETVTEEPRFAWYADAGDFSNQVTGLPLPDTQLQFDKHEPTGPGPIHVWVVVHDERGGTDFTDRILSFQ